VAVEMVYAYWSADVDVMYICVTQRKAAESCASLKKLGKPTILVSKLLLPVC